MRDATPGPPANRAAVRFAITFRQRTMRCLAGQRRPTLNSTAIPRWRDFHVGEVIAEEAARWTRDCIILRCRVFLSPFSSFKAVPICANHSDSITSRFYFESATKVALR